MSIRRALPFFALVAAAIGAAAFVHFDGPVYVRLLKLNIKVSALDQFDKVEAQRAYLLEFRELSRRHLHPLSQYSRWGISALGDFHLARGEYEDAVKVLTDNLELTRRFLNGKPDQELVIDLHKLANASSATGRFEEAERLFTEALAVCMRLYGPQHQQTRDARDWLLWTLQRSGKHAAAEEVRSTSAAIAAPASIVALSRDADQLVREAHAAFGAGRTEQGVAIYETAIELKQRRLGSGSLVLTRDLLALGDMYRQSRRFADAERQFRTALRIRRRELPADHLDVAETGFKLAQIHIDLQQFDRAQPLLEEWAAANKRHLPLSHPQTANALTHLAANVLRLGGPDADENAYAIVKDAMDRVARRAGESEVDTSLTERHALSQIFAFEWQIAIAAHILTRRAGQGPRIGADLFTSAQWIERSSASRAFAQMAARTAAATPDLAELTRSLQDATRLRREIEAALLRGWSLQPPARQAMVDEATRLQDEIERLGDRIGAQFPDYAKLADPKPVGLKDVETAVAPDEIVLMYALADTHFVAWGIVNGQSRVTWFPAARVRDIVRDLRCGLDIFPSPTPGCDDAIRRAGGQPGDTLPPFHLELAHELYRIVLAPFADWIGDKHIVLVPAGPLQSLPFGVLVTEPPPATRADYGAVKWLGHKNPITVLTSVASLRALPKPVHADDARRAFLGFGNPLLSGEQDPDRSAEQQQDCAELQAPTSSTSRAVSRSLETFFRGGLADVSALRNRFDALPETVGEVCRVAQAAGVDDESVYLGRRATETNVKDLSRSGRLAGARIVYFATHGLLAGDTAMFAKSRAEPSLLLTPPEIAAVEDDGLLTASEIAQLRLDAELVVLSACNTAAADGDLSAGEALSGLARAFFYAGARAIVVSHWRVASDATVSLMKAAFAELTVRPALGRAAALRAAMHEVANSPGMSHPAMWAPFVLVGDGSR